MAFDPNKYGPPVSAPAGASPGGAPVAADPSAAPSDSPGFDPNKYGPPVSAIPTVSPTSATPIEDMAMQIGTPVAETWPNPYDPNDPAKVAAAARNPEFSPLAMVGPMADPGSITTPRDQGTLDFAAKAQQYRDANGVNTPGAYFEGDIKNAVRHPIDTLENGVEGLGGYLGGAATGAGMFANAAGSGAFSGAWSLLGQKEAAAQDAAQAKADLLGAQSAYEAGTLPLANLAREGWNWLTQNPDQPVSLNDIRNELLAKAAFQHQADQALQGNTSLVPNANFPALQAQGAVTPTPEQVSSASNFLNPTLPIGELGGLAAGSALRGLAGVTPQAIGRFVEANSGPAEGALAQRGAQGLANAAKWTAAQIPNLPAKALAAVPAALSGAARVGQVVANSPVVQSVLPIAEGLGATAALAHGNLAHAAEGITGAALSGQALRAVGTHLGDAATVLGNQAKGLWTSRAGSDLLSSPVVTAAGKVATPALVGAGGALAFSAPFLAQAQTQSESQDAFDSAATLGGATGAGMHTLNPSSPYYINAALADAYFAAGKEPKVSGALDSMYRQYPNAPTVAPATPAAAGMPQDVANMIAKRNVLARQRPNVPAPQQAQIDAQTVQLDQAIQQRMGQQQMTVDSQGNSSGTLDSGQPHPLGADAGPSTSLNDLHLDTVRDLPVDQQENINRARDLLGPNRQLYVVPDDQVGNIFSRLTGQPVPAAGIDGVTIPATDTTPQIVLVGKSRMAMGHEVGHVVQDVVQQAEPSAFEAWKNDVLKNRPGDLQALMKEYNSRMSGTPGWTPITEITDPRLLGEYFSEQAQATLQSQGLKGIGRQDSAGTRMVGMVGRWMEKVLPQARSMDAETALGVKPSFASDAFMRSWLNRFQDLKTKANEQNVAAPAAGSPAPEQPGQPKDPFDAAVAVQGKIQAAERDAEQSPAPGNRRRSVGPAARSPALDFIWATQTAAQLHAEGKLGNRNALGDYLDGHLSDSPVWASLNDEEKAAVIDMVIYAPNSLRALWGDTGEPGGGFRVEHTEPFAGDVTATSEEPPAVPAPVPAPKPPDTPATPAQAHAEEGNGVSVPFIITKDTRQQLYDLGYSRSDVDSMTPAQAQAALKSGASKTRPQGPLAQADPTAVPISSPNTVRNAPPNIRVQSGVGPRASTEGFQRPVDEATGQPLQGPGLRPGTTRKLVDGQVTDQPNGTLVGSQLDLSNPTEADLLKKASEESPDPVVFHRVVQAWKPGENLSVSYGSAESNLPGSPTNSERTQAQKETDVGMAARSPVQKNVMATGLVVRPEKEEVVFDSQSLLNAKRKLKAYYLKAATNRSLKPSFSSYEEAAKAVDLIGRSRRAGENVPDNFTYKQALEVHNALDTEKVPVIYGAGYSQDKVIANAKNLADALEQSNLLGDTEFRNAHQFLRSGDYQQALYDRAQNMANGYRSDGKTFQDPNGEDLNASWRNAAHQPVAIPDWKIQVLNALEGGPSGSYAPEQASNAPTAGRVAPGNPFWDKLKAAPLTFYRGKMPINGVSNILSSARETIRLDRVQRVHGAGDATLPASSYPQQAAAFLPSDPIGSQPFKAWFGNSKVVNESGAPIIVHHGSASDFSSFDPSTIKSINEGPGFYFTNNADVARGYGKTVPAYLSLQNPMPYDQKPFSKPILKKIIQRITKIEEREDGTSVSDGFLSNYGDVGYEGLPKVLGNAVNLIANDKSAVDQISGIFHSGVPQKVVAEAVRDITGHDGIVANGFSNEGDHTNRIYVAWFPEQIKSASQNSGDFSRTNADIRFRPSESAAVIPVHPGSHYIYATHHVAQNDWKD